MYDFHVSDLGTQTIPNSKYYWQNEQAKCCVIVPDDVNSDENKPALVYFVQAAPNVEVVCTNMQNPDLALVSATPGVVTISAKVFERKYGMCERPAECPKILDYILTLIDSNSWSFPRAQADKVYISEAQAILLEQNFKNMVTAPNDGTCVFATVAVAGSMLASRMGIEPDVVYAVSHYDMATNTQDDTRIGVAQDRDIDLCGKKVIVIDDLISSGRTANAVIERILASGAEHIYYFALYRTICSREVVLNNDPRVTIQSYVPLSNAYWTYGRGFDLTDEASRNTPGIFAATKHWDWESPEEVAELIDFFGGIAPTAYEENVETETIE
jgi:hypoxanthine-guanine phosphoribosyltransferase